MALTPARSRRLAQLLAITRATLGVVAMAVPQLPLRPWVGERRADPTTLLFGRVLGVRDLALGLGALLAMRHDAPVRGWIEAGGLADTGDTLFTALSFRELPDPGRWLVLVAVGSGAALSRLASVSVDAG